jgi:hypothetical protein
MSGGRSQPATTTVVNQQSNDPWAPLVPHLTDLFTRGRGALEATPQNNYAGPTENQRNAVNWMQGLAPRLNTGAAELRQVGLDTINGNYMRPESNPFLRDSIQTGIDANTRNLMRNVLPGLADQAILGGAYGGSGYGVAQGLLAGETQRINTDAATQAWAQNYQMERERQLGAGSILNQANTLDMAPGQLLDLIGSQEQAWNQDALNAAQEAPWAGLDRYAALLGLGTRYGTSNGTQTSTTTAPRASGGASFLQGALGGASAGSAFGPWGAGIGGVLGGLGGLFGR